MISKGNPDNLKAVKELSDAEIAWYYLGISKLPILINSPLREDNNPSFGLFSPNGKIYFKDFATGEKGSLKKLLMLLWHCSYQGVNKKLYNDLVLPFEKHINNLQCSISKSSHKKYLTNNKYTLKCKIRDWEDYDIEYWNSYGISLEWLKFADVYPVSHKIIITETGSFAYKTDKFAYAFAEFKDGKSTLKIYQPYNKKGFKWCSTHKHDVISLWTKLPTSGSCVCICSSVKDALCLWTNTGIPAIAIQGEGYSISNTVKEQLKTRFKHVFICLDNDETGLRDSDKLSKDTSFINIVLPPFKEGKDISDMYKAYQDKKEFRETLKKLFKDGM